MSSYLSVPSNHSSTVRQSRSVPTSPVLQHRRKLNSCTRRCHSGPGSGSGSPHLSPTNSGPSSPYLTRRAITPEPRFGLTLSILQSRDSKCSHCKDSPPSSVMSFPLSPSLSSRKAKIKKPSYMRSTFAADKRSVRNSSAFSSESSSDDEVVEEKPREFAPPRLLPPIWCTDGGMSPSLRRKGDLDVLPSIRVSPVQHLEKEFAKLETCRYIRKKTTANKNT